MDITFIRIGLTGLGINIFFLVFVYLTGLFEYDPTPYIAPWIVFLSIGLGKKFYGRKK